MSVKPIPRSSAQLTEPSFLAIVAVALLGGSVFFLLAISVFSVGFSLAYAGRVLPGVSVAGMDLSGVRRTAAAQVLDEAIRYPDHGQITLSYGERQWAFTPIELGFHLDGQASAEAAYAFGRSGWPWERLSKQIQSLQGGLDLAPRLIFDGQVVHNALQAIAAEINQPTVEAELAVVGLDVQVRPGQMGLALDTEKMIELLAANLLSMQNTDLNVIVVEQLPRILDVSEQAEIAARILSQALIIVPGGDYVNNPEGWTFQPERLAEMLSIERVDYADGAQYQVGLDSMQLGAFLAGLAPAVVVEPKNARFIFNDEARQLDVIQREVIGRTLEIEASIAHINQQLAQGAQSIELQYDYSLPEIREDVGAAELGISEMVSEQTTYFYGSSTARIQNIQTAAARFHGLLVPPGATFSMVENIGDISLDSGFAEALIIYGDRTIKGVGGGVCQVSTTLFRTVFFGGFPVVERNPHAYRVYYYELNQSGSINQQMAGLDATVYAPIVDFKFVNDSPYWLLMESYVNAANRTLTWKFYSTSDGRSVEWSNSGTQNVVEAPDSIYEENEELEKGEVKQVDWEADGADVTITRVVSREGEVYFEDTFTTHYRPWAAVYQYGPNTPGYPPEQKDPVNN